MPFVLSAFLVGNLFVKISPCHIGLVECAMHNAQPAYAYEAPQSVGGDHHHAKEDAAPTKTDPDTAPPPLLTPKPAAQVGAVSCRVGYVCCIVLCCIVLCCVVLCCVVLCCVALCCAVPS